VTPLSAADWQPVPRSSVPPERLRFGDFTGDGVTDVLAVVSGRRAISESARMRWRALNADTGEAALRSFISAMSQ
jgi:hypothetical protein